MDEVDPGKDRAALGSTPTADIWTRLARLDGLCDVMLESLWVPGMSRQAPHWSITIRPRNSPGTPAITVSGKRAVEAITKALDLAEALCWHSNPPRWHKRSSRPGDDASPFDYRPIYPRDLDP
jgi:hypothetical protein